MCWLIVPVSATHYNMGDDLMTVAIVSSVKSSACCEISIPEFLAIMNNVLCLGLNCIVSMLLYSHFASFELEQ